MNTTSVKSYEVRGSNLGLGERATFFINNNVPLLDPANTFLKMNVMVGGLNDEPGEETGFLANAEANINHYYSYVMNPKIGAEALIKELTISDASSGKVIEQIFGYNKLARVVANYTDNASQSNFKKLYQGADSIVQHDTNTMNNRPEAAGVWGPGATVYNKRVEVLIPFSVSGILGARGKPFPCAVSQLRVDVLLEDNVWNVLTVGGQGTGGSIITGNATRESKDWQNVTAGTAGGDVDNYLCYQADVSVPGGMNNAATTNVELAQAGGAAGIVGTGVVDVDGKLNTTAFCVGQVIQLKLTAGWTDAIIGQLHRTGGNKIEITFGAAVDMTGNLIAAPLVRIKAPTDTPQMVCSDLELVCGVIEPSPEQYRAMESAVSGKGLVHSFSTYNDYAFNVSANALRVSNMFNCRLTMAKAILTYWENVSDSPVLYKDNLTAEVNSSTNPKSYVYQLNSLLVPSKKVELDQLIENRATAGGWNAVHVSELKKALEDGCGYKVRDLSELSSAFCCGRALKRGNTHYNFAADRAQPRLQMDFTAQSKNLLIHNWVCADKLWVVGATGSELVE